VPERIIFSGLEERTVSDDVDPLAEPRTDEAAVHLLRLPKTLRRKIAEPTDRLDNVIEVEDHYGASRGTHADAELLSDSALS
jgi:hypothetical protein